MASELKFHLTLALLADAEAAAKDADDATCAISAAAANVDGDTDADAVEGRCLTGALFDRLVEVEADAAEVAAAPPDDEDEDDDETACNARLEGTWACSAALFPALRDRSMRHKLIFTE